MVEAVGPFGRESFLQAWWAHLAPAFLQPLERGHAASFGCVTGWSQLCLAAGFGAADYADPNPDHAMGYRLEGLAGRALILPRVAEGSWLHARSRDLGALEIPYDVAPRMDLTGGWKAIQAGRSSRTWSTLRRKKRKLEALGQVEFTHVTEGAQVDFWLPRVFELYAARAKTARRGRLWQSPRGQAFLREWMHGLASEGTLDLSLCLVDGRAEAFAFGIADPSTFYLYGLAFDPDSAASRWSPGEHLLVHLLEVSSGSGKSYFDFLVGDEPYKRAWASDYRRVSTQILGSGPVVRSILAMWPRLRSRARSLLHQNPKIAISDVPL